MLSDFQYSYDNITWNNIAPQYYNSNGASATFLIPVYTKYLSLNVTKRYAPVSCFNTTIFTKPENVVPVTNISLGSAILTDSVNLTCTITGQPGVEVLWYNSKYDRTYLSALPLVSTERHFKTVHTSVLRLERGKNYSDVSGQFSCDLQTRVCNAVFICEAGYPGANRTAKSNSSVLIELLLPGKPEKLAARQLSATEAMVTWRRPLNEGDFRIVSFILNQTSLLKSNLVTLNVTRDGTEFSHNFSGLKLCQNNSISVSAVTIAGRGEPAFEIYTALSDVTNVSLSGLALSKSDIKTEWSFTYEAENCTFIGQEYVNISYSCKSSVILENPPSCSSSKKTITVKMRPQFVIFKGLHPWATYLFQVSVAKLFTSDVLHSREILITTFESTPTGKVMNLSLTTTGTRSAVLNWLPIALPKRNGEVVKYSLNVSAQDVPLRSLNVNYTTYAFSELDFCTNYTFAVSGCTVIGCGPEAIVGYQTGYPTLFSIHLEVNDTSDIENVNATATLGVLYKISKRCITRYEIQFREVAGKWRNMTYDNVKSVNPWVISISLLKFFSSYEFRARIIIRKTIFGKWSDTVNLLTRIGKPSEVQNLKVTDIGSTSALIKWDPPLYPNGLAIIYTVITTGNRSYDSLTNETHIAVVKPENKNAKLNLKPATTYKAMVFLKNLKYIGRAAYAIFKTNATPPPPPPLTLLSSEISASSNVQVMLGSVSNDNGPVTGYQIIVLKHTPAVKSVPQAFGKTLYNFSLAASSGLTYYLLTQLGPFLGFKNVTVGEGHVDGSTSNNRLEQSSNYSIYYRAIITWKGQLLYSNTSSVHIYRVSLPVLPNAHSNLATSTTIMVPLVPIPPSTLYARIVVQKLKIDASQKPLLPATTPNNLSDSNILTFETRLDYKPYVTAEINKKYFISHISFTVGDDSSTSRNTVFRRSLSPSLTFKNGPLDSNSYYTYFLRTYHKGGAYFSTGWAAPIQTMHSPAPTLSDTKVGVAIGIAVLIVVASIAAGCIFWRYYKKHYMYRDNSNTVELKSHEFFSNVNKNKSLEHENLAFEHEELKTLQDETDSGVFVLNYTTDAGHPSVTVSEFPDHVFNLKQSCAFEEEFNSLQSEEKDIETLENHRNANNHTESTIASPLGETQFQDIYANYISSFSCAKRYLATQAPPRSCYGQFWEMIWHENIKAVVMLPEVFNESTKNSSKYWPSADEARPCQYGRVLVSAKKPETYDIYVMRSFVIQCNKKPIREVMQYQLLNWPDAEDTTAAKKILAFRNEIRKCSQEPGEKILVHCSNGNGRSAVYIVIDAVLENIKVSRMVDIFNYVNHIRSKCPTFIETYQQYQFIHDVVVEALTVVNTELQLTHSNVNVVIERLNTLDPVTGYTGYRKLFKYLNRSMPLSSVFDSFIGHNAFNEYKNRYSSKIPTDRHRWRYASLRNSRQLDYINATAVNLSKYKLQLITTQAPFGVTMADFWDMVRDSKAEVIVMLNETFEGAVEFSEYWPSGDLSSITHGTDKITLELESSPISGVTKREFTVTGKRGEECEWEVQQYHLHGWPDRSTPSSRGATLELIDLLVHEYASDIDPPIVIHCSDGLGRTGTFAAILIAAKVYLRQRRVDIGQITAELREFHPYYIETESQFRYIFEVVKDFIHLENSKETTRL